METVHVTESEFARDAHFLLQRVKTGDEVIVEGADCRPVALIKQPQPMSRSIRECIALAKA